MPGWEVFGEEEKQAVIDIFDTGGSVLFAHSFDKQRSHYRVRDYEKAFAAKMGSQYCQAVSSGSAALKVALQALGIGQGDEVITQAFTFVATVEAIIECGATPIIVEINDTLNMDCKALEAAITGKTKAIIPVHMMGECCQMLPIKAIAERFNLAIVEDAAQALGAAYMGKPAGTMGDIGCYSTDAGKTLNTGEGGMVVTNDEQAYRFARAFHDHGHLYDPVPRGEDMVMVRGFNYRMTELQGAIGLAQLKKLDMIVKRQRTNKEKLKWAINKLPVQWRRSPDPNGDLADTLVFFLPDKYKAMAFADEMRKKGLGTKNLPDAINWHFARNWGHMLGNCGHMWKTSADLLERAIAIPIMVNMTDEDIQQTADKLLTIGVGIL